MLEDIRRFIIPKRYFKSTFVFLCHILINVLFQEGLRAIIMHRVSYWLHNNNCKGLAFILAKIGYLLNNVYISPGTKIGRGCKINHGGTIIHAKYIGENLEATHNITIGQLRAMSDSYPEIGNNVYLGAGARVFASIGNNVVVGANSVILKNIPDDCRATGVPAETKITTAHAEPSEFSQESVEKAGAAPPSN